MNAATSTLLPTSIVLAKNSLKGKQNVAKEENNKKNERPPPVDTRDPGYDVFISD